jgi:hypothetical protein
MQEAEDIDDDVEEKENSLRGYLLHFVLTQFAAFGCFLKTLLLSGPVILCS